MKVYITGSSGFIGYHLTQYLKHRTDIEVLKSTGRFQDDIESISTCDFLVHLAGVNRGDNVYERNIEVTNDLVKLLKGFNNLPGLIFASSSQEGNGTPYGTAKKESVEILNSLYGERNIISLKIPNVFGPLCKPHYNSFVSTFSYILNEGDNPRIIDDNEVELVYITDLCEYVYSQIIGADNKMRTKKIHVSEVLKKLTEYNLDYNSNNTIPDMDSKFDVDLFNTFRSFSNPVRDLDRKSDDRGYLLECLRTKSSNSHIFYSITRPGITRGNHFHFRKVERFIIIKGSAEIEFQKPDTKGIERFTISGDDNKVIDIPVMNVHTLKNIGEDDLICAFWTNEIFDPNNPDTYFLKIS
jgi:UDP-2-acetamido-2,6-beta-L-arabino-hexul-4-ose reductase